MSLVSNGGLKILFLKLIRQPRCDIVAHYENFELVSQFVLAILEQENVSFLYGGNPLQYFVPP